MHSVDEWNALDSSVETIIVDNNACGNQSFTVLNLTRFVNLKVFEVGNYSFSFVTEVYLVGLSKLERIMIGENSFTKCKNYHSRVSDGHFYLKDCETLKELKIDRFSFNDYSLCEIAYMPSLEVIEMGELKNESYNFYRASLELKSAGDGMK